MGDTDTPRGTLVGGPVPRGRWGGGVSFDLSGLNPFLEALGNRWGQMMDIGLERAQQMPARDQVAFESWLQKRRDEAAARHLQLDEARRAAGAQLWSAPPMGGEDPAQLARRTALNASVGRARSQQSQYGGATPFNPSGAVADFYEYGAGHPQGRGGGGDVGGGRVSETELTDPCKKDPRSPGCPEDPLLRSMW